MNLLDHLKLPETRNIVDLDDPSVTILHAKIIQAKPFLKKIYDDFYHRFKQSVDSIPVPRIIVEIGSGGGFIKEVIPDAVTSEVLALPNVDLRCSALNLPFPPHSIDAFFLLNVLHHIPQPEKFLQEISQCLKPDGKIVMIEPANTLWARWIYQNFHHEPFDTKTPWTITKPGPLSQANIALPWIIFFRDRKLFEEKFPQLSIDSIDIHTPFRYLVSGGFSFKQLLPTISYPLVEGFEKILTPFNKYIGMFMTICLTQKRD